jgi:hypothetical protein
VIDKAFTEGGGQNRMGVMTYEGLRVMTRGGMLVGGGLCLWRLRCGGSQDGDELLQGWIWSLCSYKDLVLH